MGRALYQSVTGKCYDGKKTDANRYLFLDVEAERHGILDGHGIHCATAPERLTRHSFNLKQIVTQFIQVGETASSPASGGGASSCANSTATGESKSGERENLKCAKGATASGANDTAAGVNETSSGASGQTADCSNDAGPASDVGVASEKWTLTQMNIKHNMNFKERDFGQSFCWRTRMQNIGGTGSVIYKSDATLHILEMMIFWGDVFGIKSWINLSQPFLLDRDIKYTLIDQNLQVWARWWNQCPSRHNFSRVLSVEKFHRGHGNLLPQKLGYQPSISSLMLDSWTPQHLLAEDSLEMLSWNSAR